MLYKKKHSLSSQKWLSRQSKDPYVMDAKSHGYCSRAAFKLIEINNKFHIFKPNYKVIDLGSAPGSWTQVASNALYKGEECILSIDLLETINVVGSKSLIMDIFSDKIHDAIKEHFPNGINVVLSDMASNSMGDQQTDHLRIINLCEAAETIADNFLLFNGHMVLKILHGSQEGQLIKRLRTKFQKVQYYKPKASRKESNEIYVVCINYKNPVLQNLSQ
jgi:23S rRNA (uridine2552-2'-O)-methyltransferase